MYRFHCALLAGILFWLLACAGCSNTAGYDWRDRQWAKSPHLDRVAVVVLDARDEAREAGDAPVIAPKAEVEKWTREALQKIPGTMVVGDAPPADNAAEARSATMLCRVTMGTAGSSFSVGVPLWYLASSVHYDIELIDIASGELRFKAVRLVTSGGVYNLLPLTDIPTLYQRDLAHVLRFATYPANAAQSGAATRPSTRP